MPVVAAVSATVGAVAAVGGTIMSARSQAKSAKKQRKLALAQMRSSQREQIRETRIRAAQAQNIAYQTGGQGSSGLSGGVGSLRQQLGTNLSFLEETTRLQMSANKHMARASTFGAVASIGSTIFQASGGIEAIQKGFK